VAVFSDNAEDSYHTITSTHCKHVTWVRPVDREHGSWEILDNSARLELLVSVEDFDFVGAWTTSDYKGSVVLVKLARVKKAGLFWRKTFVPVDVGQKLASVIFPKLKRLWVSVWCTHYATTAEIYSVSANVWAINWANDWGSSNVPDLDVIVPTAWDNKVGISGVKLDAEHSVRMSRFSWTTAFKFGDNWASLLIINSDNTVGTSCDKLSTIGVIVDSEQLVQLIKDGMKQLTRSRVPMLQGAVCTHWDDDILGHCLTFSRPPSDLSHWHRVFHILIQNVWLLGCEHIENSNGAITSSDGNVLIMGVKPYAETLGISAS